MGAHALVIGIDHYPKHPEWELTGAVRDAVEFAKWVTTHGGVRASDLTLLLSPTTNENDPAPDFTVGSADRDTIAQRLYEFETGQRTGADRFWFYYAGHGLASGGEGPSAGPLLVPADTGDIGFYLRHDRVDMELFRQMMQDVAPKEQFYFVDACRTALAASDHKTLAQRIIWDPRNINDKSLATQAVFLSTTVGKKAKEVRGKGIFSRVLLSALKGMGPTLGEPKGAVLGQASLYFTKLDEFVREAMSKALEELPDLDADERQESVPYATIGRVIGDVEVARFDVAKLPTATIWAAVEPADVRKKARIDFVQWVQGDYLPLPKPQPIGPPVDKKVKFIVPGGRHKVRVQTDGYPPLVRELLVYEDKSFKLEFDTKAKPIGLGPEAGLEAISLPTMGSLVAESPDRLARVSVFDGGGTPRARGVGRVETDLPEGTYVIRAELSGVPVKEEEIVVRPGARKAITLDIGRGKYVDPAENLGSIANPKFSSMLAYAAWAARWPESHGFHRLRAEGVDRLKALKPRGTAVQILVGDAKADAAFLRACRVQLAAGDAGILDAQSSTLDDLALTPLPNSPALQGARFGKPGAMRVRVEMPGFVATTFALTLLPSLITVLIVTREPNGEVEVQQHFNPIDPTRPVAARFSAPQYDDVRVVEIGARALEHREPLADNEYQRLVFAKGSNPMLGLIAGYRMANTNRAADFAGAPLDNMLASFPGLPDIHVLAGLYDRKNRDAHFRKAMETGTPIFAEGFWTLFDWLTQQSLRKNLAPPLLRRELTSGMVWTSFVDAAPAETRDRVRIVTSTGRTSLATIADERGFTAAARAVGRIEPDDRKFLSTAFLVEPRVAVVPVHVAEGFAKRAANGRWTLRKPTTIRFDLADEQSARRVVRVLRVLRPRRNAAIDGGSLDAAMLETCWPVLLLLDDDAPVAPLVFAASAANIGERVAVIGFPVDTRTAAVSAFAHHFTGASGEKHVMPGIVTRAAGDTWTFDHNCFTAPGTSGGPIVNHAGQVVGIHVTGRASKDGFKVGTGLAVTSIAVGNAREVARL